MKSNFEISTDPDFLQTPCTGSEPNLRALASTITHLRPLASTVATAASGVEHSQSAVTTRLIVRLKVQWPPRPKKQVSSLLGRHLEDLHHKQNLPMNRPEQVTNGSVSRKQSYAPAAIEIPAAKRYRSRDEAKTGDQWDFDAEIIGFPVLARRTRDTGLDIITDKITAKSKFASFAEFKSAISPEATAPTARQTKAKDCTGPVQPKPEQQIIDLTAEETLPTYSAADVAMDDEEEIEVLAAEAEAASKLAQLKRARLEFRRNKAKDGVEETRK
ncbi:hypothetical protein B0A48_14273 [Cryoendolithus antarcticus]|uniref:Uncharacterized protein n=1 Tax=Cryoendolithus antarcticus TaxID=1507870 RepID=A0A1V8SLV9_9PEZI|nr:hypothetical protein B0A48_14273 [Cryoendolithus antarcticus]